MKLKQTLTNFDLVLIGNLLKIHACCGEGRMLVRPRQEVRSPFVSFVFRQSEKWVDLWGFFSSYTRITFIPCCNHSLHYIPYYDRAYLIESSNSIYLSENTQCFKIISGLFNILQQNCKLYSHNCAWIFWHAARNIYHWFGKSLLIFFTLHLTLLIPAINLTAESRLGSNWNSH